MEIFERVGACRVCYKLVTSRQHAFECDNCRRWVHRLCGTGISFNQYRDIMDRLRHGGSFEWLCPTCDSAARKAAVTGNEDGELEEVGLPTLESTRLSSGFQ